MPVSVPPAIALREFLGATTRHVRRVEIYEQDGVTRWDKDTLVRLKDGQVTVDYSRAERRALDLTLSNSDGVLINAPGEFWYDKIIKIFRGVQVNEALRSPSMLIITDDSANDTMDAFIQASRAIGFDDIHVNPLASSLTDLVGYDIIVSLSPNQSAKNALIKTAYDAGYRVATFGGGNVATFGTALFGTGSSDGAAVVATGSGPAITPRTVAHPLANGWSPFSTAFTQALPTTVTSAKHTTIAFVNTTSIAVSAFENQTNRWAMFGPKAIPSTYANTQFRNLMLRMFTWLNPVVPVITWEVQIGEFMIDRISETNFPYDVKVTGRDYTKKCMLSKFAHATQFLSGLTLESLIADIAGAAGITKRILPVTGIVVGRTFFFERGVTRWDALKEIATAYDHEIFFDATGYLVIRPYNDPATTPPALYLETGKAGQVGKYEKSTTDTRLYNHIIITGESSDANVIPVWAEAKNEVVGSPTSIAEIGDRLFEYTSAFITTQAQADALALSFLAIHSLQEFELSFDSLMLPWLEVGDILGWIDPKPAPGDPTTFLLSSLNIPLSLSPMSGMGKRVAIVGS